MIRTIVTIILLFTLFSTHILAAEFYTVHDRTTQKCTVADKPPITNIRTINLATDAIYQTRREAEFAMKVIKVCSAQK
jgi:hypothetical protein